MRFVIVDAGQYAYENNKISPEYIDKLKGMYKLETIWEEMQKHQHFGWINDTGDICSIVCVSNYGIKAHNGIGINWYNFKNAFNLTFVDGTPFGIKE